MQSPNTPARSATSSKERVSEVALRVEATAIANRRSLGGEKPGASRGVKTAVENRRSLGLHRCRIRLDELRFLDPYAQIEQTENRLPHWQQPGAAYFVTFRLTDAVPKALLDRWQDERTAWLRHHPEPWTPEVEREYHERFSRQFEQWLDAGHGSCALREPRCAGIAAEALAFFEGARCTQLAWVVMPTHVHTLFVLHEPWPLESIVASWKRHAAREINRLHQRTGALWQKDYFDRLIRDSRHLANCVRYVRRNPEKARLRPGEALLWESELAKAIE